MWELICDHRYRWGTIAADRSPYHSDGHVSGVTALPGQAGLHFSTPQSRVAIPRKADDAWSQIGALRVEIVASTNANGGTLIDADQCFRLRFVGLQKWVVEILGQTLTFDTDNVPADNWITLQFSHDGLSELSYGWSYDLSSGQGGAFGSGSPIPVPGQVPPVGPQGVWIGNQIGRPANHLNGNIASVKIWRLDPKTMTTTFIGRPFPPALLDCWASFLRKLREASRNDPQCAVWLVNTIKQIQKNLLNKLAQKGPDKTSAFWDMCKAYQKLWTAGKVGSPEMQALGVRLRDWLKDEGLLSLDDPGLKEALGNPCFKNFIGSVGGLQCDPEAQALIKAILGA